MTIDSVFRYWRLVAFIAFGLAANSFAESQSVQENGPALKETQVATDAFSRGDPIPAWVEPVGIPPTYRTNPIITRLFDTQLRVGDTHIVYVNRAIQANDNATLSKIGQFQLYFVPQYQKLRLHRVLILRGTDVIDQTSSVNVRFLEREAGLEQGTYSGGVTVSLLLSDVRVGDTLHISYSVEGSNPVFGNTYSDSVSWDQSEPVELRNVVLSYPVSRKINWKMVGEYRNNRISPESRVSNGYRILHWQESSFDGIDAEPNVPDSYFAFRILQFSEYENWNQVAKWADSLFPPAGSLPDELKNNIEKWRQLPVEEDRVISALQWVQSEIRYFSVSLGESSHRPYPPAEVVKRRFGDCKDKTYLLLSILRELGIDARPVLLSIRSGKTPAKLLATPDVFDHVVLQVKLDGQYRYIDGTRLGQRGRLSQMGPLPDGIQGLVVGKDVTDLLSIHTANHHALNTIDLSEDFVIPRFDGTSTLKSSTTCYGAVAESFRVVLKQLTSDQLHKFALGDYEQRYPGIALVGEPEISDDINNNSLKFSATYSIPKLANEYNGNWGIKFFPRNFRGIVKMPQQMTRKFPLAAMDYPYSANYALTVTWPADVASVQDPSHQHSSSDFFDYDIATNFRGNIFSQSVKLNTLVDVVEPKQLPKLLEDMKKFERALNGYVSVDHSAIKDAGLFGIGRTTLQDNIRKQLQKTIDNTSKTIADGHLTGEDLAAAYCDRAFAYGDIGNSEEGLKDANEAVRLAPQLSKTWECRGYIGFAIGDFSKSVADYSKALSLGSDAFQCFYRRGHSRFYLGKYAEAADDFAKAVAATSDESDQVYASLWQIWTLQRINKTLPPDLVVRANKDPRGSWPRPALAMFTASLTPEQMLAEANKKSGDELEMTLAEAYFYLGQYRHNLGQNDKAEEAFKTTRQKGITMYIEHMAAGFELGQTPKPQK